MPFFVITVRSVASQKHPDVEYLMIDGWSSDGTVQVGEVHQYPPILCCSQSRTDAMHKGLSCAMGAVVGFLDAVLCSCRSWANP
ncbi:glycosyltransferase [Haematospirillum sp. H1815]|uniref:glycosyltransferase n=1 Tax=Haematospirillum sp. H1815 TaxID=2723108 RepID=UPI001439DF90|nr:glycosyltransferase [Haematospirillum sp. H1815]NKD76833.1 glycosyltransferase [Haematospirillum sp. H1815]